MIEHQDVPGGVPPDEVYISVDIEASGPVPGEYSMLAVGACLVGSPGTTFYAELRPINDRYVPEALRVGGLSMSQLALKGENPARAMTRLQDWVRDIAAGARPVFVGFNASFDWAFVNWYFTVFVGENPFGISALDIKSFYMALVGSNWEDTSLTQIRPEFRSTRAHTHNALDDAKGQAEMFLKMLAESRRRSKDA